jgi:DNA mismatch repair protein MutS
MKSNKKLIKVFFFIEESARIFSSFIDNLEDKIKAKKTEKDGYFLSVTKLRAKTLVANIKEIEIKGTKIKPNEIKIRELDKGNSKITFFELDKHSDLINKNKTKVISEAKRYYLSFLDIFYESKDYLDSLVSFISYFDYVVSNVRVAVEYNYCKPKILSNYEGKSFMEATKLRHPLIERIIDLEYIPHDISLGKDSVDGMLIYGINSAGKSSLMKSVGVSLIMAQCGMYVPAETFNFKPYKSLYARISSSDNLFKGLSSFAIELTEIDSILKRATPNTLVIGDEVCKSTETTSAHSLVAATLIFLSRIKSSFIFATHLHDISKIKLIKELTNIKSYHLSVIYDELTKKLIFDRILKEGQGDSVYGITVAKFFIQNNDFMKLTNDICHDLNDSTNLLVSTRKSRYNASLVVDECLICHAKDSQNFSYLDTHHINFQKNCENGFVVEKPHIPVHSLCNLVVLCKKCHQEVHNGTIAIKGYIQTSKGRELFSSRSDENSVEAK